MIKDIYFFDDQSLQNKCRTLALQKNNKGKLSEIIVPLVMQYINTKWENAKPLRKPLTSEEFYLLCRNYGDKENSKPSTFIERAVKETLDKVKK